MKKVFSVKKFEEVMEKMGFSKKYIKMCKLIWANDCEGLTPEEMMSRGVLTSDSCMIEVEDKGEKE